MAPCSYTKRCSLVAPCCGEVVCCHRCHNKDNDHCLPRQLLQQVVCSHCNTRQQLCYGDTCLTCGNDFAAYFCSDCGTANDDVPPQGYFHCSSCGICRVGSRDDYFHCDGCGCCLRLELLQGHICRRNCLETACPVCLDWPLSDSQSAADKLPCGHMAHLSCIQACARPLASICTACNAGSSSSAATTAASRQAPAGPSIGSNCRVSGLVRDLLDLLQPEAALRLSEEELLPLLQELEAQQLLPRREVRLSFEPEASRIMDNATLDTHPRQFRAQLEAAILRSVIITASETLAKGVAIDAVVQLLLRNTSGSSSALRLHGQPVRIDRIEVAGSVGKSVAVQGQWDVDLVAFVNLPTTSDITGSIDLLDPEVTHRSWWLQDLRRQLCSLLEQQLQQGSSVLQLIVRPHIGRAAVKFSVTVATDEHEHELSFDVLLAPNFAAGAGAAAAAAYGGRIPSGHPPAEVQRLAVLEPVLAVADVAIQISVADAQGTLKPSFLRNVWLSEAATEFVRKAAGAAATAGGVPGRVVISTICLVKAWVRKGLQQQPGMGGYTRLKSFQLELLVLHAAERLAQHLRSCSEAAAEALYGGRYVLDLLLVVLGVVQEWAAVAAAAAAGTPREPVMFVDLAQGVYYSRLQALALQQLGMWSSSSSSAGQPLVVHAVDPTCSVFDQTAAPFELWPEFWAAAALLQEQLLSNSWGQIRRDSSLSAVVG